MENMLIVIRMVFLSKIIHDITKEKVIRACLCNACLFTIFAVMSVMFKENSSFRKHRVVQCHCHIH